MNRKSFLATLVGSIFGGKILANTEPPKPKQITANSLVLTNSTGESFTLTVNEAGNLTIGETNSKIDRMTIIHSKNEIKFNQPLNIKTDGFIGLDSNTSYLLDVQYDKSNY